MTFNLSVIASKSGCLPAAAALILLFNLPVPAQTVSKPVVIKGGIELSDHLPPLNDRLKPGLTFNQALLPKVRNTGRWIRIPDWIAGGWHHDREITLFQRNEKSGLVTNNKVPRKLVGSERWGWQQDRDLHFWDYLHYGYTTRSHTDYLNLYNHVTSYDVWSTEANRVVVRSRSILTTVSRQSGKIVSCSQREQLKIYRPLNENLLQITAYVRNFDREGQADSLARNVIVERRIAAFAPLDEYCGKNMRANFHRFLKKNGLKNLIPPN